MRSGKPIVYTSADSVFQIAAHEDVIPIDELYRICLVARGLLDGDLRVGRVIARPFTGQPGSFVRTGNRRDFSVDPPGETLLDRLCANGLDVCGVGKIEDIFAHRGLTRSDHRSDNPGCIEATIAYQSEPLTGLIFTNLVDFDSLFGHRNNPKGYADALAGFDAALPRIIGALGEEDLLIITADHGCDPTTASTDHSREYVPVLCFGRQYGKNVNLGIRETFADIGATIAAFFGLPPLKAGTSFLHEIEEDRTCH